MSPNFLLIFERHEEVSILFIVLFVVVRWQASPLVG